MKILHLSYFRICFYPRYLLKIDAMKTILFIFLTLLVNGVTAQLNISTNFRQNAVWQNEGEKWDVYSTDEGGTLFVFNKELTTFRHTTATISSDYYITKWDYNEEELKYTMTVTSDAGNEYEMIIDGVNNCVAFFYWYEEEYYLVRHTIKNTWFNE